MENDLICLDTSVLIDYFRKTKKENSFFYRLTEKYSFFAVSVITEYEIYLGSNEKQDDFWNKFFEKIDILPFNSDVNQLAINTIRELKKKRTVIDVPDLFIGTTALYHNLAFATLNRKHFVPINGLTIISP